MYNIIPYKSKVMHAEDEILNFSSIRQKTNAYSSNETTVEMTPVWLF